MKKLFAALLLAPLAALANDNAVTKDTPTAAGNTPIPAGSTVIMRMPGGSGTPGFTGFEPATHLGDGVYHAPQYMPAYPTASPLWPRIVDVQCEKRADGAWMCDGYNWLPALGRGEYLYIRPVIKAAPRVIEKPVEKTVQVPVIVERKVFIEVPVKKKHE